MKASLVFPLAGTILLTAAFFFVLNAFLLDNPAVPEQVKAQTSTIPAFPGAEGHGALALNDCRSKPMVVHQVTNTNDSGSGSFAQAIADSNSSNFDIIIFVTGGLINSFISNDGMECVYIAGQTAPGGGISLSGSGIDARNWQDVVMRYLRHRGHAASNIKWRGNYLIADHITASWGGASTAPASNIFSVGADIPGILTGGDITVQDSLFYQPDDRHPTVLVLNGSDNGFIEHVSVQRNFLVGPGYRTPMCSVGGETTIINNVVYNNRNRAAETNRNYNCDFIANYMKAGPATNVTGGQIPFGFRDSYGNCAFHSGTESCDHSAYVANNRTWANNYGANDDGDPWTAPFREIGCHPYQSPDPECPAHYAAITGSFLADVKRTIPLPDASVPITKHIPFTDSDVNTVITRAGNSRQLTCDGSWTAWGSLLEAPDIQMQTDFANGTGPISINVDNITVPVPAKGTPCPDADADGLPDVWESRYYGSNTGSPEPSAITTSGYTVIEHYLNGTSPLGSSSPTPTPTPTTSLVAHWTFDEGSGTTAADFSGNGNTGTLVNGPAWATGQLNTALNFDGVDDVVTVADSSSLNIPYTTVAMWVKWDTLIDNAGLLAKGDNANRQYWLWTFNGNIHWEIDEVFHQSLTPLTTGRWYHVALTYDGSNAKLYLDGTLDASFAQTSGTILTDADPLLIGRLPGFGLTDGQIDDVRVYNYALSATEIADLVSSTPTIPGDLNQDGKVDITDVSRLLSRFGSTNDADLAEADINGPQGTSDGKIDLYDANTLMANWTG